MKGFLEFVRTQGVVGLAVGFILGGAVSNVVKSFVPLKLRTNSFLSESLAFKNIR